MPSSFYHSTVKYESSIAEGVKDLESLLLSEIKENLRTNPNSDSVIMEGASLSLKNMSLTDLRIRNLTAYFSMSFTNVRGKYGGQIILSNYHLSFSDYGSYLSHDQPHLAFIYEDEALPYWYAGRISLFFNKNNFGMKPAFIEDTSHTSYGKPLNDVGFLSLTDGLISKLCSYSEAQDGFPSSVKGNFSRMFYLSASTITTVGFGDIVPITTLARTLLAIEAIWGIIIIGLFLNSLANRVKLKQ